MNTRVIGLVFVLAVGRLLCSAQNSITVNYAGGGIAASPLIVIDNNETPLANGNDVEIGYFDSSFNLAANAGNLSALAAARANGGAWHLFGATNIQSTFPI